MILARLILCIESSCRQAIAKSMATRRSDPRTSPPRDKGIQSMEQGELRLASAFSGKKLFHGAQPGRVCYSSICVSRFTHVP